MGNLLITGPPGCGKSTVIDRVQARLEQRGLRVGGLKAPEVRRDGRRVGFALIDVDTGQQRTLAHVDLRQGPSVGRYTVDVAAVDALCEQALSAERIADLDAVLIDEIAPMELHSQVFVAGVRRALDSPRPVLAAVHQRSTRGLIGEVKQREDAELVEVTPSNRDGLPERLVDGMVGDE